MQISLKCFASLSPYQPKDSNLELPAGATVGELIARLGIDSEQVQIVMLNGLQASPESRLQSGDRLGLFPAVGGG